MVPKKLLLITPFFHPNVGGVETRLNDLVRTVSSLGHEINVISYQPLTSPAKGSIHEKKDRVSIWRVPWPGNDRFHRLLRWPALEILYILPGLFLFSFFYMILYHKKIDTIHTPGLNAAIIGKFLRLIFRKRWVMSTHTIYEMNPKSLFSKITRFLLTTSDRIVALSEPSRDELIAIGLSPERISTELTWVDQDHFRLLDKKSCRDALRIPEKAFVVLFVGRLLVEKGIDILIELARELPETTILVVGLGPKEGALIDAAKKLRNISFHGHIPQGALPVYYNAADIFILPSLNREGLGRVVIESLACGLPALLSDTAAIGPLVEAAAFRTPPRPDAMAALIRRLMADGCDLERKRKNTRKLAENTFGPQNVAGLLRAYGWAA